VNQCTVLLSAHDSVYLISDGTAYKLC